MRLGTLIADWRYVHRLGVREVAKNIGVSAATLNRFERGENCDAKTLTKILAWGFSEPTSTRRATRVNSQ